MPMADVQEGTGGLEDGDCAFTGVTWEDGEHLDYRTIAKAGGRKDLLHHVVTVRDPLKAATWPKSVDWFDHPDIPRRKASPYRSPLKNHWSQWDTQTMKLPSIVDSDQKRRGKAAVPAVTNKEGVDFTRLLALDYQREWLQRRTEKEERQKRQAKERKEKQQQKLLDHALRTTQGLGPSEQKQPFVMKRFAGVPARVKLPPLT